MIAAPANKCRRDGLLGRHPYELAAALPQLAPSSLEATCLQLQQWRTPTLNIYLVCHHPPPPTLRLLFLFVSGSLRSRRPKPIYSQKMVLDPRCSIDAAHHTTYYVRMTYGLGIYASYEYMLSLVGTLVVVVIYSSNI